MVDLVVRSGLKTREQINVAKTVITARMITVKMVFCMGVLAREDKKRFFD